MGKVFSVDFEPILLPQETATFFGTDFPKDGQPVRCRAVGALPEYQKDWGAITASATWSNEQEDTNLQMPSLELAQLRMMLLDNFQLRLKNPSAVDQWRTNKTTFFLKQFPDEDGPQRQYLYRASEFFVWEDTGTPRFLVRAYVTLTASRVVFNGWRFKLEKITKDELTSKMEIWLNSWPGGK